jgi:hypothetical protein
MGCKRNLFQKFPGEGAINRAPTLRPLRQSSDADFYPAEPETGKTMHA